MLSKYNNTKSIFYMSVIILSFNYEFKTSGEIFCRGTCARG